VLFSGAIPAWVAMVLCVAAGSSFGSPTPLPVILLAGAGTLVIYGIDRLRDLPRDQSTSPLRSAFVRRNRQTLVVLSALAGVFALALGLSMPLSVWALCGAVGGLGLLHRRLKSLLGLKTSYVTLSWVAITVGLPALVGEGTPAPTPLALTCLCFGGALAANLMVSNLRDGENLAGRHGRARVLLLARSVCVVASLAVLASPAHAPLAAVPLAELGALGRFRPSERYGMAAVDGALGLGALVAVALFEVEAFAFG